MKLLLSITTAPEGCGMEGQIEEFSESGGTFGRGPSNQWILPDPSRHVSSTHGRVSYQAGQFFIEDASTNGTYMNNEEYPIGPGNKKLLSVGDLLVFGDYTLQVDIVEESKQPIASDETLGFALPASSASGHGADANSFDDLDKWLDPIPQKASSNASYSSRPMSSSSSASTHLFGDIEHKSDSQDPLDALAGSSQRKEADPFSLDDLLGGGSGNGSADRVSQIPPSQANLNRLDLPRIPNDDSLFGPSSKPAAPEVPRPQSVDDPLAALGAPSIHHTGAPFAPPSEPLRPAQVKQTPEGQSFQKITTEPPVAPHEQEGDSLDDFLGLETPDNKVQPKPQAALSSAVTTTFEAIKPEQLRKAEPEAAFPDAPLTPNPSIPESKDPLDDFLGVSKAPLKPAPKETPITAKEARSQLFQAAQEAEEETCYIPEHLAELPHSVSNAHEFAKDHFVQAKASPTPMALQKEEPVNTESEPSPEPQRPAPMPSAQTSGPAINNGTEAAIVEKLGLEGLSEAQKTAFPTLVAKVIKETVKGLMTALRARNQIKSEFRMNMTMIQAAENNPLKFSVTLDDALENMFMKTGKAYLPAPEAISDGFADLADHQIALFDAMRVAYESLVKSFDPLTLEETLGGKSRGFLGAKKGLTWDSYKTHYEKLVADKEDSFKRLFGEVFAAAYEKRMNELKMNRKR